MSTHIAKKERDSRGMARASRRANHPPWPRSLNMLRTHLRLAGTLLRRFLGSSSLCSLSLFALLLLERLLLLLQELLEMLLRVAILPA